MNIKNENYAGFQTWSKQVASWRCITPILSIVIEKWVAKMLMGEGF